MSVALVVSQYNSRGNATQQSFERVLRTTSQSIAEIRHQRALAMASSSSGIPQQSQRSWRDILNDRRPAEYTPANSVYEQDITRTVTPGFNKPTFQRFWNGLLHLSVAGLLLSIMSSYILASDPESKHPIIERESVIEKPDPEYFAPVVPKFHDARCRAIAIIIVFFTAVDIAIDLIHTMLLCLPWSAVALVPQLLTGIGYLAIFMAYVGLGKVFPAGYTYWRLKTGYSGPVVYLFLWTLGLWDLLHVCIHRHKLGTDSRLWRNMFKRWRESRISIPVPVAASVRDGTSGGNPQQVRQAEREVIMENGSTSIVFQRQDDENKALDNN